MTFKSGEVGCGTPPETISHVGHVELIVVPGVAAVGHAGPIIVGHAANQTLAVMIDDDVVVDTIAGGHIGASLPDPDSVE